MNSNDINKIIRQARSQGWRVKKITSGYLLFPSDKNTDPIPVHVSKKRRSRYHSGEANLFNWLRKSGLDI